MNKNFFILLILSILLMSCGKNSQNKESVSQNFSRSTSSTNKMLALRSLDNIIAESSSDSNISSMQMEQKLIKTANIQLEIKDTKNIGEKLNDILKEFHSYISDSREWEDIDKDKYFQFSIRVPQENFDNLISKIKDLGEIKSINISSEDISKEYYDIQARLNSFKKQEERYLDLLNKAINVEEILKVEVELNRIRTSIEQLEGQIRFYDNRVSLATIHLNINPVKIIKNNFFYKIFNSFKEAISGFFSSINSIIIFLGVFTPWFILFLGIFWLLYKLFKIVKR